MKLEIHIHNHNHGEDSKSVLAELNQIKELIVMSTQETINQITTQIETAKATITEKIATESQQVQDFIAAHPEVDTSQLQSAVDGLNSLGDSIGGIFPDAPAEETPVDTPPSEETPAVEA